MPQGPWRAPSPAVLPFAGFSVSSTRSSDTPEAAWQSLRETLAPLVLDAGPLDPTRFHERLREVQAGPFAKAGIEGALWDVLANASGGNPTRLDPTPKANALGVGGASWSPGSDWIAYARIVDGTRQLVKLRPGSSGDPVVLTDLARSEDADWLNYPTVTWSPDGNWIAYPRRGGCF